MNILYAIQGTGNGHMTRAVEVGPALEQHGKVDYMVSGAQVDIDLGKPIKYRSNGLGFYFGKSGGVDLRQTVSKSMPKRFYNEIKDFPIEKYDLIINDFEPVTAWASKMKGKKCVALSHQSALLSKNTPKPLKKDIIGKLIINKYAPADIHYGFHFSSFDKNIYTPIIRKSIRKATSKNFGHYTVYLPAFDDERMIEVLRNIKEVRWEVFSKHTTKAYDIENISIRPVNGDAFVESMVCAEGILCGAGFETPSEALYLGKKLMVVPMKNQYEQVCNAIALEHMGIPVLTNFKLSEVPAIRKWIDSENGLQIDYPDETESIVNKIIADQSNC